MPKYSNNTGRSNIKSYQIPRGGILVKFKTKPVKRNQKKPNKVSPSRYLYTNQSAGKPKVSYMRKLAIKGNGLNSYINRKVRTNYASKK